MILTNKQKKALEKMTDFLNNSFDIFLLKGYAGTGKTTILKEFIKKAKEEQWSIKPLASTGKAAKVLGEKIEENAITLHSAIYNNPHNDETGKTIFDTREKNNIKKQIYIIDEASMIGNIYVENNIVKFGTGETLTDLFKNKNTKIIFVGDPFQLLPVKNNKSYALDKNFLEDIFQKMCDEYTLTDIIRQTNTNFIVKESLRLRNNYNNDKSFKLKVDNKDIKEFTDVEAVDFFIKNQENTAIITYTNKDTLYYSNLIREKLGMKDIICDGDKLLVVYNNQVKKLNNGEIITVKKVIGEVITKRVRKDEKIETLNFQQILTDINGHEEKLYIVLDLLQDENYTSIDNKVLPILNVLKKQDEILGNALQVRYGYAITCHKSQGSEFDNVILKLQNEGYIQKEEECRWLYTAITRAKKKLFILNNYKESENLMPYEEDNFFDDLMDEEELIEIDSKYKERNKYDEVITEQNQENTEKKSILEVHYKMTVVINGVKHDCIIINKYTKTGKWRK